ncbi:MAG: DUF3298 and DUF4163 domain-containing protein [Clostridiales bacterium]|nr:DUF3298 and DUF4163 domain-containing protein [Clostridiales bacterium]
MMKRNNLMYFVSFAAAAGIVLSGCGLSQDQQENSASQGSEAEEKNQEEISSQEPETNEDDQTADDDFSSGDAVSTAAVPKVTLETEYRNWYSDDEEYWLMQAECDSISVTGDGCDVLCTAVNQWNAEQTDSFWNYCEDLSEDAAACIGDSIADPDSYFYESCREIEVARVDESVLSLVIMNYDYLGGAHGYDGYTAVSFDAVNGDILELEDILEDTDGFQEAAESYIIENLEENYSDELFEGYEDAVASMWDAEPVWYLDAEGITFVFNAYELGPYSMGEAIVTCSYEEFGSYMKDSYAGMNGAGAGKFSLNTDIQTTSGTLSVNMDTDGDEGMYPLVLSLDGETAEAGEFGRFGEAYLLTLSDGRSFVLCDADYASDDYVTFLYEITDGEIVQRSCLEDISLQRGVVSPDGMTLRAHLDVLGTYYAYMDYEIGESGALTQTEDVFEILQDGYAWRVLTTMKELPVTVDGETTMLPEGSRIRITGTDNEGTASFTDEDTDAAGSILYERGDGDDAWTLYIDGVSEYEYFEMIPYAG